MKKFRLIRDNDCHWYIIPADKTSEFYEWCRKMANDEPCDWPEWLKQSDGPHRLTFDEYHED